ncbi:adenylate cyclase [Calothrix sp. NIES-4101]|nr:adenylate cyclase [Calothrix sp. NIES-4101]
MGKLVILKLGTGNFEQGFPVILQIGDENAHPSVEITGELPPNLEIPRHYHRWQTIYHNLKLSARPIGLPKPPTSVASIGECQQAAAALIAELNIWLQSESFRPIREKWLEKLAPKDRVRVLLQTKDLRLQKLPWHLWDLLERYPNAEIALIAPAYEEVKHFAPTTASVNILAILGDSEGIDTQSDQILLQKLPNADVTFLVEPERQDLNQQLWDQPWQILFFAGHSSSLETGETGLISINKTENLTISQLKYALKQAVARGLQLAIFNSCDGLGLARELADLQIPQIIVMREPVPDRVAQEFLKHFLAAFARGESLYLAVREAREKLQGLENHFPCATWLPVIYQNPAQIPLNWQELVGVNAPFLTGNKQPVKQKFPLSLTLLTSVIVTGLVMGVRYLGALQAAELAVFDQLMRSRPQELPDSRILVIQITEEDVQNQAKDKPRGSLSDASLSKILAKISQYQPIAIGLDIYHDYPIDKKYPELVKLMQQNPNFVAVCQVSNPQAGTPGIKPPPGIPEENTGFSDTVLDNDNVVRRHLLALTPPLSSPCTAPYSLNVQLALRYLSTKGIKLQFNNKHTWQLGKLRFQLIERETGGYQGIDAFSHQILLNYRSSPTPEAIVPNVTLKQVLSDEFKADIVKDKIILIGTTAESFRDYSLTPYKNSQGKQQEIPGVFLQAQMTSQLLSAVLDGRPILSTWWLGYEIIWVWLWSMGGILITSYLRKAVYFISGVITLSITLYLICLNILTIFGYWIPLIPALMVLLCSAAVLRSNLEIEGKQETNNKQTQ